MIPQVIAVKARLMQDDARVQDLARGAGVKRLTMAAIYAACGCRITRTRKVLREAQMALRGNVPANPNAQRRYEEALLSNALVLATRTTAPAPRRRASAPRLP